MADAAITVLLETSSHLLDSCNDLISGAEYELRRLTDDVKLLKAILRKANLPEEAFGEMERQIEEVVFEAQDTIDSYLIEAAAAECKIHLFPRHSHRRILVAELVGSLAEEVRSFREDEVKQVFAVAGIYCPNFPPFGEDSEQHQIVTLEIKSPPNYEALQYHAKLIDPHLPVPRDLSISRPPIFKFNFADAAAKDLLENISKLSVILGGDLVAGVEEELRLLRNQVELLRAFLRNAPRMPYEVKAVGIGMAYCQIEQVVDDAQDIINSYLSRASAALRKTDLFRRGADVYTNPDDSLSVRIGRLSEDKLQPMLEKAGIDSADMLLIG